MSNEKKQGRRRHGVKKFEQFLDDDEPKGEELALIGKMQQVADRLGETSQICVFVPTTIGVDVQAETTSFLNCALSIMGECFGGATSSQGQGVWNSDEVGLVDETVYIVRSYVTKAALDQNLAKILGFVGHLKEEMQQEAMAVEVNNKLILI